MWRNKSGIFYLSLIGIGMVMAAMDVNSWGITVEEAETRFLYRRISWSRRTAGFRNRIGLVVS